jgi:hypothetical protein
MLRAPCAGCGRSPLAEPWPHPREKTPMPATSSMWNPKVRGARPPFACGVLFLLHQARVPSGAHPRPTSPRGCVLVRPRTSGSESLRLGECARSRRPSPAAPLLRRGHRRPACERVRCPQPHRYGAPRSRGARSPRPPSGVPPRPTCRNNPPACGRIHFPINPRGRVLVHPRACALPGTQALPRHSRVGRPDRFPLEVSPLPCLHLSELYRFPSRKPVAAPFGPSSMCFLGTARCLGCVGPNFRRAAPSQGRSTSFSSWMCCFLPIADRFWSSGI